MTKFRNFRDNWLAGEPDGKALIREYYETAPVIVRKINDRHDKHIIYKSIWEGWLRPCLTLLEKGGFAECKQVYVSMVRELQDRYIS